MPLSVKCREGYLKAQKRVIFWQTVGEIITILLFFVSMYMFMAMMWTFGG